MLNGKLKRDPCQGKADFSLTGNGGDEPCGNPSSTVEKVGREGLLLLSSSSGIGNVSQCWEKPDLEQMEQGGLFEREKCLGEREMPGMDIGRPNGVGELWLLS